MLIAFTSIVGPTRAAAPQEEDFPWLMALLLLAASLFCVIRSQKKRGQQLSSGGFENLFLQYPEIQKRGLLPLAIELFACVGKPALHREVFTILRDAPFEKMRKEAVLTEAFIRLGEVMTGKSFYASAENAYEIHQLLVARLSVTCFHGTNLSALAKIKRHGLSVKKVDHDYQLSDLIEILRAADPLDTFYLRKDMKKRCFYATAVASLALQYARVSPEWFARLVGEDNLANKGAAKRHFLTAVPHLEASKAQGIFEKYWPLYGNKARGVIVVFQNPHREPFILQEKTTPSLHAMFLESYLMNREVDLPIEAAVAPQALTFFQCPL